jgi:hypothetical protein
MGLVHGMNAARLPQPMPPVASMSKARKDRHAKAVKRRNPVARALRDAAYRARKEASRRRYSRKAKHKEPEVEPG